MLYDILSMNDERLPTVYSTNSSTFGVNIQVVNVSIVVTCAHVIDNILMTTFDASNPNSIFIAHTNYQLFHSV